MRRREVLTGLAGVGLTGVGLAGAGLAGLAAGARAARAAPGAAPAVLELFTSQGCSSCPPADALLGRLAARPDVITLAWHVDYWNGLGWIDRFATPFATARQRAYAAALRQDVFTPALVVDGTSMVIGSDEMAIAAAIATSARMPVACSLERAGGGLTANVTAPAGTTGLLAFYDPVRVSAIGAGENDGRHLREFHIVRQSMVLDGKAMAAPRLALPPPGAGQGAVLLIQAEDLRVLGAAMVPA